MDLLLYGAPTILLLAALIKAGPVVWSFVIAAARLPHMTEEIWHEFGRNGGSTTRDRIEHIARQVDRAEVKAKSSIEMARDTKDAMSAHLQADATSFAIVAQASERVANRLEQVDERLGRLEEAVARGTRLESEHAEAAVRRNGEQGGN